MAANTANKRILVTKADGSQYVETVNDELGLRAGDKEGLKDRLKKQGVDAANIDLYGFQDNTSKAKISGRPGAGHRQPPAGDNAAPPAASRFDRNRAAVKVAAVFRGKVARNQFEHEKRKVEAVNRQRQEEFEESTRPKPRQILRPKGKSYIGF